LERVKNKLSEQLVKRELRELYSIKKLSLRNIAQLYDCSSSTVLGYLRRYNIKTRTLHEIQQGRWKVNICRETLKQLYGKEKRSVEHIANSLRCSSATILKRLKRFDIPVRSSYWRVKLKDFSKDYLRHLYLEKELSATQIANKFNCSVWTVINKLKELNIFIREPSFYIKKLYKDPQWVANWVAACHFQPNKMEKKLNVLLGKILPGEYRYTGDGKFLIDGLCPDFVNCNGQKKIIELFGRYWHVNARYRYSEEGRKKIFAEFGYRLLVIWDDELKSEKKVIKKITDFNRC